MSASVAENYRPTLATLGQFFSTIVFEHVQKVIARRNGDFFFFLLSNRRRSVRDCDGLTADGHSVEPNRRQPFGWRYAPLCSLKRTRTCTTVVTTTSAVAHRKESYTMVHGTTCFRSTNNSRESGAISVGILLACFFFCLETRSYHSQETETWLLDWLTWLIRFQLVAKTSVGWLFAIGPNAPQGLQKRQKRPEWQLDPELLGIKRQRRCCEQAGVFKSRDSLSRGPQWNDHVGKRHRILISSLDGSPSQFKGWEHEEEAKGSGWQAASPTDTDCPLEQRHETKFASVPHDVNSDCCRIRICSGGSVKGRALYFLRWPPPESGLIIISEEKSVIGRRRIRPRNQHSIGRK